jgi:hypothetical protein
MDGETATTGAAAAPDLSEYEIQDVSTLKLKNAKGDDDLLGSDKKPVFAEVYSSGSKAGVRALHKAGLASQMRTMRMLRGELDKRDAENADQERVDKLVGFTRGFTANFPFEPSTVYGNPKLGYIARQIEEHVSKDSNFAEGSSGS